MRTCNKTYTTATHYLPVCGCFLGGSIVTAEEGRVGGYHLITLEVPLDRCLSVRPDDAGEGGTATRDRIRVLQQFLRLCGRGLLVNGRGVTG